MNLHKRLRLTRAEAPCKDCPDRTADCHCAGKCEKYAAFRAECDAVAQERKRNLEYGEYLADAIRRAKR